jgi:tetratricopeptide (TPR) repeat protein
MGFQLRRAGHSVQIDARMSEGSANPARRWVAGVVAIAAAVWLCYAGGKHELASHYALSSSPDNWERATHIEPDNPETWYRLARYRQLDFDNTDIPLSISDYQHAMRLNPRSPYYKLDLAGAYEMAGNSAEADNSFRAAQSYYPISSEVSWKYGNFLLRQNRFPEAYAEIHRALLVDPKLLPLAISRVWHSDPDVHLLVDQVLPETPQAYSEALSFLADTQDTTAALEVWRRLIAKDPHTDMKWGVKLTDMLLGQGKYDDASSVWRQAVTMSAGSSPYSGNSLIYDGGFERDISGGGLGWQQKDEPGADFDFDTETEHSGSRAARVTFDGTKNLDYHNLFQPVLVSPGARYRFQGFLRTDQITTDSGMRFEIVDPKDPQHLDVLSPNETGTTPWTLEELDFTAGPQTHLVLVRLARRPSERLDNKLNGTVWVDDLMLVPAGTVAGIVGLGSAKQKP